jgi:hypothetical protein
MQKYFNEKADNRHQSYVKHRLQDILVMIMCAVLCGLDELSADNIPCFLLILISIILDIYSVFMKRLFFTASLSCKYAGRMI